MQEVLHFDWTITVMMTDIVLPGVLPSGDAARGRFGIPTAGSDRP